MQVVVFARDDDYFFGVLHPKFTRWALRQGTWLESRPRYAGNHLRDLPPLAARLRPTGDPRYQAIAEAARELAEARAWLSPPNAEVATQGAR